jgi:hypothetical protein
MNQKILVITVVAVFVVAGLAIVVFSNSDNNTNTKNYYPGGTSGCLQVYGNANNDYIIDEEDKTLVQNLISNETGWNETYPFADANYDGTLNSDDVTYLEELINASETNKVIAHVLCYASDCLDGYVEDVLVPVTSGAFNFSASTIIAMHSLCIKDEICAITCSTTWETLSEPLIYDYYEYLTANEYSIGASSVGKVDATLAANFTKLDNPLTCYIISSSNSYDYYNVRGTLSELGISVVQISDGSTDPLGYASGILLLGYLFGTTSNNYVEQSQEIADWYVDYNNTLTDLIEKIDNTMEKKNCVVSLSANNVQGLSDALSETLSYYGLEYALDSNAGTGAHLTYNPSNGDTWLNAYDIDVLIVVTSQSSSDWRWYDSDKDSLSAPSGLINSVNTYSTMENFGDTLVLCTTMPAPLKAMFIMEYAYPELFEDISSYDYLADYYHIAYGWSEDCLDGVVLAYTASEFGLA